MPNWEGSNRRSRLPSNWSEIRKVVLHRDNDVCQWYTETYINADSESIVVAICGEKATDVDHIKPNDDNSLDNLRALCKKHHQKKSSIEGAKALAAKRRQQKRRTENHPGFLD